MAYSGQELSVKLVHVAQLGLLGQCELAWDMKNPSDHHAVVCFFWISVGNTVVHVAQAEASSWVKFLRNTWSDKNEEFLKE